MPSADMNDVMVHYEGLIHTTALRYSPWVEESVEDIKQILRIKAWKAVVSFDASKARGMDQDRYVFSCMWNQCKDLVRKKKRNEVYIEDVASPGLTSPAGSRDDGGPRDRFDARYLSVESDAIDTLDDVIDELEFRGAYADVARMLHDGFTRTEIYETLGLGEVRLRRMIAEMAEMVEQRHPEPPPAPLEVVAVLAARAA